MACYTPREEGGGVYRHKVRTFEELLADARETEQIVRERNVVNIDLDDSGLQGGPKRIRTAAKGT